MSRPGEPEWGGKGSFDRVENHKAYWAHFDEIFRKKPFVMDEVRYRELSGSTELRLSDVELDAGYHFCDEWDGMLVGPDMVEMACCSCPFVKPEHRLQAQALRDKEVEEMAACYEDVDPSWTGLSAKPKVCLCSERGGRNSACPQHLTIF